VQEAKARSGGPSSFNAAMDLVDPWGASAYLIEIDPKEVLPAWEAAHTDRHPVCVCEWSDGELDADHVWRSAERERTPEELLAAPLPPPPAEEQPGFVEDELAVTRQMFGDAPSEDEVRAALGEAPGELALDRWLLEWEKDRGPSAFDGPSHMEWFVPEGQRTYVLLADAPNSETAMARLDFWGYEVGLAPERLVGLVRSWRERFGAELVANWGTMLQFVVHHPPADLEAAYALAVEHYEVAPETMLLPGVPIREHARDLVGRGSWFLHSRP
jgi:hypothetical protein